MRAIMRNVLSFTVLSLSVGLAMSIQALELSQVQKDYLDFVKGIYFHAREAKRLQKPSQDVRDIFWSYTSDKQAKFERFIEDFKDVQFAIMKIPGLNKVNGIEVIPQSIHNYITASFGRSDKEEGVENINLLALKLIGGMRDFGNGKVINFQGVIEVVDRFDFREWMPMKNFMANFHSTIARARQIDPAIGNTLIPVVENYFVYMETISRLRVLQGVLECVPRLNMTGEINHDLDQVAVILFQNTGPILIKLFQQFREEITGESSIDRVLKALKKSKPIPQDDVEKALKSELKQILNTDKLSGFKLSPPLGIASIAQTHAFSLEKQIYVAKLRKAKVRDIFDRERKMILNLVSTYKINGVKVFDKGMKQRIFNISEKFEEEMDFSFERDNIIAGQKAYTNPSKNIATINLPKNLARQNRSEEFLIMTRADGREIADVMDENLTVNNVKDVYEDILKLYEYYLQVALDVNKDKQFFHGDLHSGNIFYDIATRKVTLIDFGNASTMPKKLGFDITQVLMMAQKTNPRLASLVEVKQNMQLLSDKLKNISLCSAKYNSYSKGLIDIYFKTCFNPYPSADERLNYSYKVSRAVQVLESREKTLLDELKGNQKMSTDDRQMKSSEILEVQDNIDFSRAVLAHCLNDITYPVNATIVSNYSPSTKLKLIFNELQKNGISMPPEVIFFNKSKYLLEGILGNIIEAAQNLKVELPSRKPETVFKEVLSRIEEEYKKSNQNITGSEDGKK